MVSRFIDENSILLTSAKYMSFYISNKWTYSS